MFPFPFNENQFYFFFIADHQLVGQLCTNPKIDSEPSIMSESDAMFNDRDRRCAAVQLMHSNDRVMTSGPLPAPSKCNFGLPRITGTCPG